MSVKKTHIDDFLENANCFDDISGFLQAYPPTNITVCLRERWKNRIRGVNFTGSKLYGFLWDTEFYDCDLSGANLSHLKFRDNNGFLNCKINKYTIPPVQDSEVFVLFKNAIHSQKNKENVEKICEVFLPIPLVKEILDYYVIYYINIICDF